MRILHTSDWHLGRTLEDRPRIDEQRALLEELAALLDEHRVDLLVVAGDVFDTFNPPAAAEQLFYDALVEMSHGGRRGVVVIAGNHDSPDRVVASGPLAERQGIHLLGFPDAVLVPQTAGKFARRAATAPGYLELAIPGVPHPVALAALAYPSEARLRRALSESGEERAQQRAYAGAVRQLLDGVATRFRDDAVNLVASHLFVLGGLESDSERPIQLGGACAVPPDVFPARAHYVGLGHLHRPQAVAGSPVPARYSGSLMACSFKEAGQEKSVVLVDAVPGAPAQVQTLALRKGRPLVLWEARGYEEAMRWCEEGKDPSAWIDLTVHGDLGPSQVQALRKAREGIVHVKRVLPAAQAQATAAVHDLPLDEAFRAFYGALEGGAEPDPALVDLFCSLVDEDGAAEEDATREVPA